MCGNSRVAARVGVEGWGTVHCSSGKGKEIRIWVPTPALSLTAHLPVSGEVYDSRGTLERSSTECRERSKFCLFSTRDKAE